MKLSNRLSIELDNAHRSCNVCHAMNYDSDIKGYNAEWYKRTDQIYDLTIGGITISICPKCLKNLRDMIDLEINNNGENQSC